MPQDLCFLDGVLCGNIELEGDVDLSNYRDGRIVRTHDENRDKFPITYKRQRKDLTRLHLRNVPLELVKSLKSYLAKKYGYVYGYSGQIVNMTMELRLKMEKGTVKIVENGRSYARHVLSGVVVSPLQEELMEVRKENQSLKALMKRILSLLSGKNKPAKSNRAQYKLDKAVSVLNEVKKCREVSFTADDYKTALIRCFGQADHLTIKSDVDALKSAGIIFEDRMVGFNGVMQYKFGENDIYSKYNGPVAMRRLLEAFKSEFCDSLQASKHEVYAFIRRVPGLYDSKPLFKRFEVLLIVFLMSG